jgi:hypothetical protein
MLYESTIYDEDMVSRHMERTLENITVSIGAVSLIFMILYIVLYGVSLKKIQNNVVKSIGIFGLIFSVFMISWDFVMMGSPLAISFDEVGIAWVGYFMTSLGFSIVMLVQYNRNHISSKNVYKENVLDDLEFE